MRCACTDSPWIKKQTSAWGQSSRHLPNKQRRLLSDWSVQSGISLANPMKSCQFTEAREDDWQLCNPSMAVFPLSIPNKWSKESSTDWHKENILFQVYDITTRILLANTLQKFRYLYACVRWTAKRHAKAIGHFQKYRNNLCLSSKMLHNHCFNFLLAQL